MVNTQDPILGNLPQIRDIEYLFEYQKRLARTYGKVSTWSMLGRQFLVIADPEINKRIYQTEWLDFGRGGSVLEVYGDIAGGLILQDSTYDSWSHSMLCLNPPKIQIMPRWGGMETSATIL